jgi:hypothetical protein
MLTQLIGSTWRHIKQTNNYTNSNLLFIDGNFKIFHKSENVLFFSKKIFKRHSKNK